MNHLINMNKHDIVCFLLHIANVLTKQGFFEACNKIT